MMVSDVAPAEGGAATGGTAVILVMLVKDPLEAKKVQAWSLAQSFIFVFQVCLFVLAFQRTTRTLYLSPFSLDQENDE